MRELNQIELDSVSGGTFCFLSWLFCWKPVVCKPAPTSCTPKPPCEPTTPPPQPN